MSNPPAAAWVWIGCGLTLVAIGGLLLPADRVVAGGVVGAGLAWLLLGLSLRGPVAIAMGVWSRAARLSAWFEVSVLRLTAVGVGLVLAVAARAAAGDGSRAYTPLHWLLWIAAILLVVAGLRRPSPGSSGQRWSRREVGALLVLAVAALTIRAWGAGQSPYVLSGDEGSAGLTAWEFVSRTRNNLLGLGWFSFPALYFWLLSLSQSVFGRTTEAIRWVSAIGGTFAILATFVAARALFGRRVAWWSAAWLALFHEHIFFSRIAYNNIWDGGFLLLAAGSLWVGWTTGRRSSFLVAGLAVGLAQYFYTTAHLIPVVLAAWLILLGWQYRPDARRLAGMTSMVLAAASVALPLGLLYLAHPDQLFFTASRVSMLVPGWIGPAAAALGTTPLGLVLEQMQVTALGLTLAELQGVYYAPGVAMLFSLSALLFYVGLVIALVRLRDPRYSLLLLVTLATIIVGGLSIQAPNSQRMLILAPVLSILVVLPLDEIARRVATNGPWYRLPTAIGLSTLVAVMTFENGVQLFGRYFPHEEYGSLNGEVTQSMIELFSASPRPAAIYFIGGDRMGFDSIPSLAYLLPGVSGKDLVAPFDLPSGENSPGSRVFIVLPEQEQALPVIEARYGPGTVARRYNRYGRLLFYVVTTGLPSAAAPSLSPSHT